MFTKSKIQLAIAALLAAPLAVHAEVEVSGYLKNETAYNLDKSDIQKFENTAKFFFNGDVGDIGTWHGELSVIYDTKGIAGTTGPKNYSQNDWFRELYMDTSLAGWDLRLGKQQVVWGTADGIKLLDIINPTDFSELNQNAMEDARIPIWMINAERNIGESSNLQLIVSQVEENKIPGLDPNDPRTTANHPFVMKGVDTIIGPVNGFYNITPALANVATSFHFAASGGLFDVNDDGAGDPQVFGLAGFTGVTVDGFASNIQQMNDADGSLAVGAFTGDESIRAGGSPGAGALPGGFMLDTIAQTPGAVGLPAVNGNNNVTNLVSAAYNPVMPDSAFEYMPNATFATFNTFSGATTQYMHAYPQNKANAGFRFKNTLDNGINWSFNYFYHYDANPAIDLSWNDTVTGEKLTPVLATSGDFNADGSPDFADPTGAAGGGTIAASAVPTTTTINAFGQVTNATTVLLRNSANQYYGPVAPNPTLATSANPTALRFTERLNRIHSIGTSFDYAFDAGGFPIVLRGEFLYDKDTVQPVVDRRQMAIGNLTDALKMESADIFKYVIGADVTVFTNLLVSGQFIQYRNLDYVNQRATCNTQSAAQGSTTNMVDCSRYTADFATLHLTNGLNQAEENKEFYSLFLSKPFGESQLGRVNNIVIYEEGGGWWDRIDAEYSLTDQVIVSGEINMYWGDKDTTFGQFDKSDNVQLGVKFLFD